MAASADQPVTDVTTDVARNPSVANPPIAKEHAGNSTATALGTEKDSPQYTPPGLDDKLSRSYIPIDSKPAPARSNSSEKASVNSKATTTAGAHQGGNTLAIVTPESDIVRSPTTISGGSDGGGHSREGSAFANGAAVTGPNSHANVDESMHTRAATAETNLSSKMKRKLSKAERE
jgi:hypothetical protein